MHNNGTAEKEGDGRAYYDCVTLKIQYSIRNIFANCDDIEEQKTDPDGQCPTEHTKTIPTATPFLVVEILSAKKVAQFKKFRQSVSAGLEKFDKFSKLNSP